MPRLELEPEVLDDFDQIFDHAAAFDPIGAADRIRAIIEALDVLSSNPFIGRPVPGGKRELVIGKQGRGYVALYRYAQPVDIVFVLAVRAQREAGQRREA
ncbi:type II toxin-antitoxin system RelE/ParE family toxin [Burkholderiaceae bacterium UC74_6]